METNIRGAADDAKGTAANYIELSSQAYRLFFDALASRTQRRLHYWQSVWEISARPYHLFPVGEALHDGAERTTQILDLTVNELKTDQQKTADFSDKLLSIATQFQDASATALRAVVKTAITNSERLSERGAEATRELVAKSERFGETIQHQFSDAANESEEAKHRGVIAASTN